MLFPTERLAKDVLRQIAGWIVGASRYFSLAKFVRYSRVQGEQLGNLHFSDFHYLSLINENRSQKHASPQLRKFRLLKLSGEEVGTHDTRGQCRLLWGGFALYSPPALILAQDSIDGCGGCSLPSTS
jgi:hypothetical protein